MYTPCTKIIVSGKGKGDKDDTCPKGKAGTTFFAKGKEDGDGNGDDGDGMVGGLGPCGGVAVVR